MLPLLCLNFTRSIKKRQFFAETSSQLPLKIPFLAENAILEKRKIFWKAFEFKKWSVLKRGHSVNIALAMRSQKYAERSKDEEEDKRESIADKESYPKRIS